MAFETMDELVAEIRRRLAPPSDCRSDGGRAEEAAPEAEAARQGPKGALDPPPIDHRRRAYTIEELTAFHGQSFITHVYRSLLKREPDPEGFDFYLGRLSRAECDQLGFIREIAGSEEGAENRIKVIVPPLVALASGDPSEGTDEALSPVDPQRKEFALRELTEIPRELFIRHVYRQLLKREPDQDVIRQFEHRWDSGQITAADLIYEIHRSPEGRRLGLKVHGLRLTGWKRAVRGFPILGRVADFIGYAAHLPEIASQLQALQKGQARLETVARKLTENVELVARERAENMELVREMARSVAQNIDLARDLKSKVDTLEIVVSMLETAKADREEVQEELDRKADSEWVRQDLAQRISASDLAEQLRGKIDRRDIGQALAGKADIAVVEALAAGKAEREEVARVERALAGKADTAAVEALAAGKAEREDVVRVERALAGKADTSVVEALAARKAEREDVARVEQALGGKADASAVEALAARKAEREDVARVEQALGGKAEASAVEALAARKAEREDVARVEQALGGKAEASAVEALAARKAEREDVEQLEQTKASREELANGLAQKGDRDLLQQVVDDKLDNRDFSAAMNKALAGLHSHTLRITDMERRLLLLLEEARKRLPEPIARPQLEAMLKHAAGLQDALYADFEETFRGTREDIRERQRAYLGYLGQQTAKARGKLALDLGCGRGEFLEVLAEAGFSARGVDLNGVMVRRCQELDLAVEEADALEYLHSQKAGSYSVISAFHLVEHLPTSKVVSLLDEAVRALKPGGLLILETPNPRNLIVGSCNFYYDPTHLHPLPPELLRFLVEARGFVRAEIKPLHPVPEYARPQGGSVPERLAELLYGPQDYGIIAWKA